VRLWGKSPGIERYWRQGWLVCPCACAVGRSEERREDEITLYLKRSTRGFMGFVSCAVAMSVSMDCWQNVSETTSSSKAMANA
jgi:hypothetical protein